MSVKFNTYKIEMYENDDFEFVTRMYINGEVVIESATNDEIEMKIAEWEYRNNDTLYTETRAAEKAEGNGFSGKDYENLQTEGNGYSADKKDIPAWR
jgi:hypothetical protein